MSMPTPENRHNERKPGYELVYWCGNVASGKAGADTVSVQQNCPPWGMRTAMAFKLPEQQADLETFCNALERAHAQGMRDKAIEIRRVLAA